MSDVRLTWAFTPITNRQRPIAGVRIEARVSQDLPWTEIAFVDAPATDLLVQDVAPGDWFYRGIVVDTGGAEADPVEASAQVNFDGPSPLVSLSAEVI